MHPKQARALVSGPVVVQRLETEGDGAVTLYLADDPGIVDRACPSASAENAAPVAFLERESQVTIWSFRPASGSVPPPPRRTRCA